MTELVVPAYVKPNDIAAACGMTRKVTLAELKDAGLIERRKTGYMRVSTTRLRELRPALFERVYLWFAQKLETSGG